MTFWKKKEDPRCRVGPGDLAEFVAGSNKGKRCLVKGDCSGFTSFAGKPVWHIKPLQSLDVWNGQTRGWPAGLVIAFSSDTVHAKDEDLRKIDPLELEGEHEGDKKVISSEDKRIERVLETLND